MAENAVLNYEYLENENDGIGVLVEMAKAGKIDCQINFGLEQ